jgi:lysylphosphatidylglycerol synthetase-like protein (DUF2156 family)
MTQDIEKIEEKRLNYLKWYIFGFTIFIILMLVRHFFRLEGINKQVPGMIVLGGLILSVAIQALFILLSALLEKDIRRNPTLKASLQNELVQSISQQSWLAAYLGAAGMTLLFAVTWFFYPLCDPVTISLCSIAMGAGANRIYFYFRYKNI